MPREREEVKVITTSPVMELDKLAPPDLSALEGEDPNIPQNETREQTKARLVHVLSRGVINDVLNIPDFPHDKWHYEWVRADPMQVQAMRAKGFKIDTEFSTKRAIHSDGSSGNQVSDVVCMVCTRDNYEILQEIAAEERKRMELGSRTAGGYQKEVNAATGGDIPTSLEQKVKTRPLSEVMTELQEQTRISGA